MSRTLVRYTIPLDSSSQQSSHRLGVNSLAIDRSNDGTLYSAGRDGIIAAWDLKMTLSHGIDRYDDGKYQTQPTAIRGDATYKRGIQAHTHWVNQIATSSDAQSVYSCSSDTLVKCWRPNAFVNDKAETLGSHTDYVKCLVVPTYTNEWIATGGLDRSIIMWDTTGKGEKSRIDGSTVDGGMKQSIYSMVSGPNILASGGIEKVIRVWDARSGSRITKFIGHTDNVRAILCSDDGKTFISASSDTTVKIWDLTAGRCLHTLTMHADPVWTLASDHPHLAVFHSADRSGLVLKHDLRPQSRAPGDLECTALCKETTGVNDIAQVGEHLFTATSSSNIHRWRDLEVSRVDPFVDPEVELSRMDSNTSASASRSTHKIRRQSSVKQHKLPFRIGLGLSSNGTTNGSTNGLRPTSHVNDSNSRRISMWSQSSVVSLSFEDETKGVPAVESLIPVRNKPESIIKGQAGLTAHSFLTDRRRVLTQDTEGRVKLWDITQCREIKDFGTVDLQDVEATLMSNIAIGSWCSVNTRVGALTIEMDPRNLLDAETYFDSIPTHECLNTEARNQRFNIGRWMLKALFQGLIDAEKLADASERAKPKSRKPGRLDLGNLVATPQWTDSATSTPRGAAGTPAFGSKNPYAMAMSTPGASIGLATPAPTYNPKPNGSHQSQGSMSSLDTMASPTTPGGDYFSSPHGSRDPDATPIGADPPTTPGSVPKTPGGSSLMKNMKWLRSSKGAKSSASETKKTSVTIPNMSPSPATMASTPNIVPNLIPGNFKEFVDQQRRKFAEEQQQPVGAAVIEKPKTWIQDLEPMPELHIPPNVNVSLANFQPGEGEAKDLYRGTVGGLAGDLDNLRRILPVWLGQILLLNEVPPQMANLESNKHYFSFLPHPCSKLQNPFGGTPTSLVRLGAARSLRIRKALTYISQRLGPEVVEQEGAGKSEEEWLEIVVNGTTVDPDWTLMMTRRHLWKQGGDIKLEYRLKREASDL